MIQKMSLLTLPTKWQVFLLVLASISTATSGTILVTAYGELSSPMVDKSPIIYQFIFPEPFERTIPHQTRIVA